MKTKLNLCLEQIKYLDYDDKKRIYEAVRAEMIKEEIVEILRNYRAITKEVREEKPQ